MSEYPTLREANAARHLEWTNNQTVDLVWRGTELAGEIGELIDLLLAPKPELFSWNEDLWDELADGVICLDLTSMTAGLELPEAPSGEGGRRQESNEMLAACLGSAVGGVCNILKKLERENRDWPGSRTTAESLAASINHLYRFIAITATRYGVSLDAAVQNKFNATSEKVGLKTRLAA